MTTKSKWLRSAVAAGSSFQQGGYLHKFAMAIAAAMVISSHTHAQTIAPLATLGATDPTPGANDVAQLIATGNAGDGLNYYDDNGANNDGWMGQTFTTAPSTAGFILTSVAIKTGGSGSMSGLETLQPYFLRLYSVSGTTATLLQTYTANDFTFADGDWLQWSGLTVSVKGNATYAYTFGRSATGTGWEALATDAENPYTGGEICSIPAAGGAVTFGNTHTSDGVFSIGLTPANLPVSSPIVFSPANSVYAGTVVTLSETAKGSEPLHYQWLSDGGNGGALSPIASATGTNYTFEAVAGTYQYQVTVTNPSGSSSSPVGALTVLEASAPIVTEGKDTSATPDSTLTEGRAVTFSAAFEGTLPIDYQWQVNKGAGFVSVAAATNSTLSLTNLQVSDTGIYRLTATNVKGQTSSTGVQLTVKDASHPAVANASFENPVVASGAWSSAVAPGWDGSAFGVQHFTTTEFDSADPLPVPADGNQACYLNNSTGTYIYQDVAPLLPSTQYTLTVAVGTRLDQSAPQAVTLQLVNGTNASGALLAQTTFTNSSQGGFEEAVLVSPATGVDVAGDLTIVIKNTGSGQVEVDNVRLSAKAATTATAPSFVSHPAAKTIYATRAVSFNAVILGTGPLALQWQRNGNNIADSANVSGSTSNTLTIAHVTASDAGDYQLVVTNSIGTAVSSAATLTVKTPVQGSYEAAVTALNPLAYYRLNEKTDASTGSAVDNDYWGGFNGTYAVNAQNGFNDANGPLPADGFIFFEAGNEALRTSSAVTTSYATTPFGTLSTNTVSFTLWVKPSGSQATWSGLLMTRGGGMEGGLGYGGTADMLGYTWNNNSTWSYVSDIIVPQDQWSFLAMVIEPDKATLYNYYKDANNKDVFQTATNVIAHTSDVFGNNWRLGSNANDDPARSFNGDIDEVAVYTYSLSAAQVMNLYKGIAPVTAQPSKLTIIRATPGTLSISWDKPGKLQAATSLTAGQVQWTDVSGASPVTVPATAGTVFYRVLAQ